ncbi:AMP-binding protein [Nocardioides sp. JQ2195]|uniref:class I adenylate-forming enzyme family protein n=1 Tax=Nocardioides sp. JQ2195 TaxID=2592334 RepID=UPI00143E41A2|nr:AMP-binding protein [Nocardioides sp. JQ2195]QIX26555.1 AMP-binding protein [Nocardioides sp. JQ2195]
MATARPPATLVDLCLHQADRHGPAVAIVDDHRAVSYAQLAAAALRAARSLIALGVRPGDRVLLSAPNSVDWVIACFSTLLAGAVCAPVNHRAGPDERVRVTGTHAPAAVIGDPTVWSHAGVPVIAPDRLVPATEGPGVSLPSVLPSDTAVVLQTSGTTGQATSVPMRHGALLDLYTALTPRLGLTPDDVLLGVAPLAHGFGLFGVLLDALLAGASVRLVGRYDRTLIAQTVRDEGITALFAPPTVFHDLRVDGRRLGPVCRMALTGGAEVSLERFHQTCDLLGVERRYVGYGMTEAYGTIAFGDVTDVVGATPLMTPMPGLDLRIVDHDGADVPPGGHGEVLVRGASVVPGPDGWLHTGDLGRLSASGELCILSRLSDTLMVSGFNIRPGEVEDVLREGLDVEDAIVVGLPDARSGERLVGCVVPAGGRVIDPAALREHCRDRLADYKVPTVLMAVDALPTTSTGKLSRAAARELVLAHLEPQGDRADQPS